MTSRHAGAGAGRPGVHALHAGGSRYRRRGHHRRITGGRAVTAAHCSRERRRLPHRRRPPRRRRAGAQPRRAPARHRTHRCADPAAAPDGVAAPSRRSDRRPGLGRRRPDAPPANPPLDLDWSYPLLDPAEQALYARTSAFAGGASLDAVVAVCVDDVAPDVVGTMAAMDDRGRVTDRSILRALNEPRATRPSAAPRPSRATQRSPGLSSVRVPQARFWESRSIGSVCSRQGLMVIATCAQGRSTSRRPGMWRRRPRDQPHC